MRHGLVRDWFCDKCNIRIIEVLLCYKYSAKISHYKVVRTVILNMLMKRVRMHKQWMHTV